MKTQTLFAALIAASFSIAPAAVQAQPTAASIAVPYADLDLGSADGRRTLDLRIVHAVNAVCGDASPADLRGQNAARACRTELHAAASAQRETALAASRQGAATALAARR